MEKKIIIGIVILVVVIVGLLIWGNYIPKTIDSTCDVSECGPALGMPNQLCSDGITSAGPTGRCLLTAEEACVWEVTSCPTQIANPASTYCINNSGTLEMRSIEAGQYGVCKFSDGSECEEWKYFRKECSIGGSYPAIEGTACTMEYAPICGINGVTYSNRCMAGSVQILKEGEC